MNYLVEYTLPLYHKPSTLYYYCPTKIVQLKDMSELRDFMLLLPEDSSIKSVKYVPTYDNLQDAKVDLNIRKQDDIEYGKLKQKT